MVNVERYPAGIVVNRDPPQADMLVFDQAKRFVVGQDLDAVDKVKHDRHEFWGDAAMIHLEQHKMTLGAQERLRGVICQAESNIVGDGTLFVLQVENLMGKRECERRNWTCTEK